MSGCTRCLTFSQTSTQLGQRSRQERCIRCKDMWVGAVAKTAVEKAEFLRDLNSFIASENFERPKPKRSPVYLHSQLQRPVDNGPNRSEHNRTSPHFFPKTLMV